MTTDRDNVFKPGKLWSLWDLINLDLPQFMHLYGGLIQLERMIKANELLGADLNAPIPQDTKKTFSKHMRDLLEILHEEEFKVLRLSIEDIVQWVDSDSILLRQLMQEARQLRLIMGREMRAIKLLLLDNRQAQFFDEAEDYFGQDVKDAFNDAIYEIDEAVKCFAIERYTACVCHLMRCCEVGLYAFMDDVGAARPVKPAQRNWGFVLREIDNKIKDKWPHARDQMGEDYRFAKELHSSLVAIKDAYRNEAMHISGKYDKNEAEQILATVKGFMQKAATRLSAR